MQLKKMVFKGSFWRWVSDPGQVMSHHTAAPFPAGDMEKGSGSRGGAGNGLLP